MDTAQKWSESMLTYHLPRWEELPDFDLYMDQVLELMDEALTPLFISSNKSGVVTATMINNYVKQDLLSKPEKRKYNKKHLASIFAITILKRILTIPEISQGIEYQMNKEGVEGAYDSFCEAIEQALQNVLRLQLGNMEQTMISPHTDPRITKLHIAALGFACQTITEKTLYYKKLNSNSKMEEK